MNESNGAPIALILKLSIEEEDFDALRSTGVKGVTVDAGAAARVTKFENKTGEDKGPHTHSGRQVFGKRGAFNVSLQATREDLLTCGYVLTDCFVELVPRKGGKFNYKLVLAYEHGADPQAHLPNPATRSAERVLFQEEGYRFVHIWDNGPGVASTVNLIPEQRRLPKGTRLLRLEAGMDDLFACLTEPGSEEEVKQSFTKAEDGFDGEGELYSFADRQWFSAAEFTEE